MNVANMPLTLMYALREMGYDANHLLYTIKNRNVFGYPVDRVVDFHQLGGRVSGQIETLRNVLEEDFDIYHFWNRSLAYRTDYTQFSGFDIPLIKARGKRIVHRFTGYDLRLPSRDLAVNPHSPFRYEQASFFDEGLVVAYQDFLKEYVDRFVVQDPELLQFFPSADIVPRGLDLAQWEFVGVERPARPLVVHAPSNAPTKGSRFVLAAVEQLKSEGLAFDFKLLDRIPHEAARAIYRKADVIVDQLLIGATGVMTLEAWALGKPVVVNLRRDLFEPFYGVGDLPVVNANPDNIVASLRQAIGDADLRQDLSKRGRALVEAKHDIRDVAARYAEIYEEIYAAPSKLPTGTADIAYFGLQYRRAEAAQQTPVSWVGQYRRAFGREIKRLAEAKHGLPLSFRDRARAAYGAWLPLARRDYRNVKARLVDRSG